MWIIGDHQPEKVKNAFGVRDKIVLAWLICIKNKNARRSDPFYLDCYSVGHILLFGDDKNGQKFSSRGIMLITWLKMREKRIQRTRWLKMTLRLAWLASKSQLFWSQNGCFRLKNYILEAPRPKFCRKLDFLMFWKSFRLVMAIIEKCTWVKILIFAKTSFELQTKAPNPTQIGFHRQY